MKWFYVYWYSQLLALVYKLWQNSNFLYYYQLKYVFLMEHHTYCEGNGVEVVTVNGRKCLRI